MRYKFGKNWKKFIHDVFSEERLDIATKCLMDSLLLPSLEGKSFLDIGCGSGIHSLGAWKSGARFVVSMDYDIDSVKATYGLWLKAGSPRNWKVIQGDVLDTNLMNRFQDIDIVYSWGVLHHTGNMYRAIENASLPLRNSSKGGVLCIALYSYNSYKAYIRMSPEEWLEIKRKYNNAGSLKKRLMELEYVWQQYDLAVAKNYRAFPCYFLNFFKPDVNISEIVAWIS